MFHPEADVKLANSEYIVRKIIQVLHSTLELDEIFQHIVQYLGQYLQADRCFISRYDERRKVLSPPTQEYRSSSTIRPVMEADTTLWSGLCQFAKGLCHYARPIRFDNTTPEISLEAHQILERLQVQSGVGSIIRFQDECLAVLFIQQSQPEREWTEAELEMIEVIAEQAGIAIHHARLYQKLQALAHGQKGISELYRKAIMGQSIPQLFEAALNLVAEILGVSFCKIIEKNENPACAHPLVIRALKGFDPALKNQGFDAGDEPHSVYTLQVKQPVITDNIYQETRFRPSPLHERYKLISGISAVIYSENDVFGVLEADSQTEGAFTAEDVLFMQNVANVLGIVLERKRIEVAVREANERFRALVDNVKDYAIYLENTQGIIESWNLGAERIYGYTPEEALGKHFSIFLERDLIDSNLCEKELSVAATQGRFEVEGWRIRKDGSQFWANIVLEALRDENGQLIGFTNITRDMSERKQADQALLEYQHQLEQSNKSLEIFAAMASHDLKAPLRKIAFFSDHIHATSKDKLDEENLEDLERIRRSVQHMQNLVDDFLVLARVSKKDQAEFQPVDLFKIAHKVIGEYSDQIQQKQAHIEIGPLFTIQGEPGQLEPLFHNLIGNALKFQRPDVPPMITITSDYPEPGWAELRIKDNGIGFPQEQSERIFEPLERLHGNARYEGTGVGLTICKRIVDQHHGTIHAESTPGAGSIFRIRFPYLNPKQ